MGIGEAEKNFNQSLPFPSQGELIKIEEMISRWAFLIDLGKGFFGLGFRMAVFGFAMGSLFMYGKAMLYHAFTPDLPWLLGGGRYILRHGHLPTTDLFSWTFPHKAWVLYQWLFEVGVAWLNHWWGQTLLIHGFIVLMALLYVVLPLIVHQTRKIPFFFTLPIASAALFIAAINLSIRPMIATSVFLTMQLLLLSQYRQSKWNMKTVVIGLVMIYALWGNMHTGVLIGLFSLLLMAVGDLLEYDGVYRFEPSDNTGEGQPVPFRKYAMFLGIAFLASLINPYGYGIYTYLANLSAEGYLNDIIVELQSPNFHYLNYIYFSGLLVIFILLMSQMRRVFSAHAMLHLLIFSIAMLFVQRFVVWTALFYAWMLPVALNHWFISTASRYTPFKFSVERFEIYRPLFYVAFAAVAGLLIWMPHPKLHKFFEVQTGACEDYAKGIKAYEDKFKQPGDKAYMLPEIGSCVLNAYPNEKVFMDTRFDFYGDHFTQQGRDAGSVKTGWKAFLDKWKINTVLMNPQWQLPYQLQEKGEYKVLYSDDNMIILRKP